MITNVNFPAPFQVLALLGTAFLIVVCSAAAIYGFLTKARWTRPTLIVIAAVSGLYIIFLFSLSLASRDRILSLGEEKHFCEIDCHIAYAVLGVQASPSNTGENNWAVRLQTRFDETTISERRPKDATLTPDPRSILMIDESGAEYTPIRISSSSETSPRFGDPLRAGDSYVSILEFRVPDRVHRAKLLLIAKDGPEPILIGSEASPLHRKTYFDLTPNPTN